MIPWDTAGSTPKLKNWDANKDVWELYDLTKDFSQARDVAAVNRLQRQAVERGLDRLGPAAIAAEIAAVRRNHAK